MVSALLWPFEPRSLVREAQLGMENGDQQVQIPYQKAFAGWGGGSPTA
jgi:hypothetical protein